MGLTALAGLAVLAASAAAGGAAATSKTPKPPMSEQERLRRARLRAMEQEGARKGRGASIVTGGQGVTGDTLGAQSALGGR